MQQKQQQKKQKQKKGEEGEGVPEAEAEKKFREIIKQFPNLTANQIRDIISEAMEKSKTGGLTIGGRVYDSSGEVVVNPNITNRADGSIQL